MKEAHRLMRLEGMVPSQKSEITKRVILSEIILDEASKDSIVRTQLLKSESLPKCRIASFVADRLHTYRRKPSKSKARNPSKKIKRQNIKKFLIRMDNATCLPGRKDALKVGKKKKQKYVLKSYMSDLWKKFRSEDPKLNNVSYSFFCKQRPANVRPVSYAKALTCLCQKHQNMSLKLQALKEEFPRNEHRPKSLCGESFIKEYPNETSVNKMLCEMDVPGMTSVAYSEWCRIDGVDAEGNKSNSTDLIKKRTTFQNFRKIFGEEASCFQAHSHLVKNQHKAVPDLKEGLTTSSCSIQMDYAENFTCRKKEEVQSFHWGKPSVTLHPIVVHYIKEGELQVLSFVIVVDTTKHGPPTVWAILKTFIPYLLARLPSVDTIHYLTDSPTSQYRNNAMIQALYRHQEEFHVRAHWLFFEAGHSKGPCDGVGGVAKRKAHDAIMQGNAEIWNARTFFEWGKRERASKVKYLFTTSQEVEEARKEMKSWEPYAVPGVMKTHAIISSPGAKGLKWRFFDHESEQAEFGLKM